MCIFLGGLMGNAQHSMGSPEWGTPEEWARRIKHALGTIDLDPASSDAFSGNIQAANHYDLYDDGLTREWHGTVYLNPPGGRGVPQMFWDKLYQSFCLGDVPHAVYCAYSLEQLRWLRPLAGCAVAIPYKRIRFVKPDGTQGSSPTHGNAFVLLSSGNVHIRRRFQEAFAPVCSMFQGTSV